MRNNFVFYNSTSPFEPQTWKPISRGHRIAIVGGGVSGLSAAQTLTRHGFANVVVFEAGSRVVPLQHSISTPHAVYDMDLIYIPALHWTGVGIEQEYLAFLQEYDTELIPVVEFQHMSRENWQDNASFQNVNATNTSRVPHLTEFSDTRLEYDELQTQYNAVRHFMRMMQPFYAKYQYAGVHMCLQQGIALPNETFQEWVDRHNFMSIIKTTKIVLALYGNLPTGSAPACHVLMMLANKLPCLLAPRLVLLAKQPNFDRVQRESALGRLSETELLWLAQIGLDMPAFMRRVKRGYGSLFSRVVMQERIDYRTNARVKRIKPYTDTVGTSRVRIEFYNDALVEEDFDIVIVTGRPHQIHPLLTDDIPMKTLYHTATMESKAIMDLYGVYGVVMLRMDTPEITGFLSNDVFLIDHMQHMEPMYSDSINTPVSVMRIVKSTTEHVLHVTFQTTKQLMGTLEETRRVLEVLDQYGFSNYEILKVVHYPQTPARLPASAVADNWYDHAQAAQGYGNIFFTGEIFAGHGVPTTWLHTRKWCEKTFNLTHESWQSNVHVQLPTTIVADSLVLMANLTREMAGIGSQTYNTLLRHPRQAIQLGIHPVLLVRSSVDVAMPPIAFLLSLVAIMCLLYQSERVVMCRLLVPSCKVKNVAIYITELFVSLAALSCILCGNLEILLFGIPQDFLYATRCGSLASMLINSMYLCELVFHPHLRRVLQLHHSVCLSLYVLLHILFAEDKSLSVMRMSLFNLLNGILEQSVFILMLLHRLAPKILIRYKWLAYVLLVFYVMTRIVFTSLALYSWADFAFGRETNKDNNHSSLAVRMLVVWSFPILTMILVWTQFSCFQILRGLASRYNHSQDETLKKKTE